MTRNAECRCGAVTIACEGEPVRVSVCHCLACKRRTGSAFSAQARWPDAQVAVTGETREWVRTGDRGSRIAYRFCPSCGATVAYALDTMPGLTAVPLGLFADPDFAPEPGFSVYERRKHRWVEITAEGAAHSD